MISEPRFMKADSPQQLEKMVRVLIRKYRSGEENVFTTIANIYIPIIRRFFIKRYYNKVEDIDSIAVNSIYKAVQYFNLESSNSFFTYLIRISLNMYNDSVRKSKVIGLPISVLDDIYTLERCGNNFFDNNCRTPTVEELSELLNWSEEKINETLRYSKLKDLRSVDDVKNMNIPDYRYKNMENIILNNLSTADIIKTLEEKDREFIIFLFSGYEIKEIADEMGIKLHTAYSRYHKMRRNIRYIYNKLKLDHTEFSMEYHLY